MQWMTDEAQEPSSYTTFWFLNPMALNSAHACSARLRDKMPNLGSVLVCFEGAEEKPRLPQKLERAHMMHRVQKVGRARAWQALACVAFSRCGIRHEDSAHRLIPHEEECKEHTE